MTHPTDKKCLELEKAQNIRHLGGYVTPDGQCTSDTFWRGDSFEVLSENDKNTVMALGVKTVIDLRNTTEITKVPSVFFNCDGIEYVNIPILSDRDQIDPTETLGYRFVMGDLYNAMADNGQAALRDIFRKMVQADGKLLFHCSAGKDRTGIIAALLLKLAGIDDETVAYDYCLTSEFLRDKLQLMKDSAMKMGGFPEEHLDEMFSAKTSSMEKFLQHIEYTYGGTEAYLLKLGLTEQELYALRDRMLSEACPA